MVEIESKNLKEIRCSGDCIILQYDTKMDATNAYADGFKKNVMGVFN